MLSNAFSGGGAGHNTHGQGVDKGETQDTAPAHSKTAVEDAPGRPQSDLNPGVKGEARGKSGDKARIITVFPIYFWTKKPHRKGTVECAGCGFRERTTVLASVIEEIACSRCGEVKAKLLPGSTPVEEPYRCECGSYIFFLRSGGLTCRTCGERPKN